MEIASTNFRLRLCRFRSRSDYMQYPGGAHQLYDRKAFYPGDSVRRPHLRQERARSVSRRIRCFIREFVRNPSADRNEGSRLARACRTLRPRRHDLGQRETQTFGPRKHVLRDRFFCLWSMVSLPFIAQYPLPPGSTSYCGVVSRFIRDPFRVRACAFACFLTKPLRGQTQRLGVNPSSR